MNRRQFLLGGAAVVAGGLVAGRATESKSAPRDVASRRPTSPAVAYAAAQIGRPYEWGATGPEAFDCSGLTMMAYRSTGVSVPRTSQAQWAGLPHVAASQVRIGDLVFFPGKDGTWTAPGHVAIVAGPNRIVQAYDTQAGVIASSYGLAASPGGVRAGEVVGYARPSAERSA